MFEMVWAYNRGRESFFLLTECPYEEGTVLYDSWEEGYNDAAEQHEMTP